MDKHILFVKSDIDSTKKLKNKNLVSFHKQPRICFNATTLEKVGILPGMYATFACVDKLKRKIHILVRHKQPTIDKSKWYKILNPRVSSTNKYCYIRNTNLLFDFNLICHGAFKYTVHKDKMLIEGNLENNKIITIFY